MMTPMRTIVDLPEESLERLAQLCERERISRAEAIRRAVAAFVGSASPSDAGQAFVLWRDRHRRAGLRGPGA